MENINFHQVVKMTHEEKVKMYNKSSKSELIEMLIECNRFIESKPLVAKSFDNVSQSRFVSDIWVSFNYGGWSLVFRKTIELPFIPFFGLVIITNDRLEYEVKLENDDCCSTTIGYNLEKQQFEINVRKIWTQPVTDKTIDYVMKQFSDWKRKDNENIDDLKGLMARNREILK